jgi:hypothetical protein
VSQFGTSCRKCVFALWGDGAEGPVAQTGCAAGRLDRYQELGVVETVRTAGGPDGPPAAHAYLTNRLCNMCRRTGSEWASGHPDPAAALAAARAEVAVRWKLLVTAGAADPATVAAAVAAAATQEPPPVKATVLVAASAPPTAAAAIFDALAAAAPPFPFSVRELAAAVGGPLDAARLDHRSEQADARRAGGRPPYTYLALSPPEPLPDGFAAGHDGAANAALDAWDYREHATVGGGCVLWVNPDLAEPFDFDVAAMAAAGLRAQKMEAP